MEYRKALLGAASILALTAGVQSSADASIPPNSPAKSAPAAETTSEVYSDPLIDLIIGTNGSISGASLEKAIAENFLDTSPERVKSFPNLLANISSLGLPLEAVARLKDVLSEIVSSTLSSDNEARESIIARLEAATNPIQLAQSRRRVCTDREIRTKKTANCRDPQETGQTPGAGGGQYQ
jgi:hypothetical protein